MTNIHIIAHIVAAVRERNGEIVDVNHLSETLENALKKLQHEDESKYLEVIAELSKQLETLSKEVGRLRNVLNHSPLIARPN
ncbi:MAG: hypothetical protein RI911_300 [Candidatus Parcubacteria bacterium]|jgi:hypothetical protein